jgi:hemoglobin-like flavoprotein
MTDRISRPTADARLLRQSLELVAPVADELIAACYDRLFTGHPQPRPMFPAALDGRRDRLFAAVTALVTHYDDPEVLRPALAAMGRRHERCGVCLEHYVAVGVALLGALREFAGPAWTAEYDGAWIRAYTFAVGAMMQAGALADEEEPLAA